MAEGGGFWLFPLVPILGLLSGLLLLNHFLPLLANTNLHGRGRLPRGSFGWPLLGETLAFLKPQPSNSLGHFLHDHCSRYGKVFKSHLFFSPTVVSCDEELNYFVLQNEGKLFQCSYPKTIHGILGDLSLLVSVGDTHKRLRSVALNLVSLNKSKPELLRDVETAVIHVLGSWKGKQQVFFCEEARKFTFNVIVKQVLGLTPEQPETTEILGNFLPFMKGLISLPLYIPGTPYAKAVQARRRIISTVKSMMNKRTREKYVNGVSSSSSNNNERDFLGILLDYEILSEDEKVSFVLDSLLGGYETTSCLLAMVVHFIGQSAIALEQLKIEHKVIKSKKGAEEHLTWDDYRRMKFTHMVINEALRFGNIVKFVHRKALKDVRYKDYLIPRGWKVLPVFTAVHLDPSLFESPFHFNPWRWEKEDQTSKKFTAFGGGNRCCPGSELARAEVAFFLHHLVHTFSWRTEDEEQPMAYPYVEFRNGLLLHLDPVTSI